MNQSVRKVLVVDDNRLYREAIRRNLEFVDYQVLEAEDLKTALEETRTRHPQVIITDLDMTHRTEGLDLIRDVKSRYPLIPVILVSAVGTFEEGAQAQELGATAVISKSRIDEELEHLYTCLDEIFEQVSELRALKSKVDKLRERYVPEQGIEIEGEVSRLISSIRSDTAIKAELYEWLGQIRDAGMAANIGSLIESGAEDLQTGSKGVVDAIEKELGSLEDFDTETETMLLAAEKLAQGTSAESESGWARNVGFSYSFAVENEVKARIEKIFSRFIGSPALKRVLRRLYDANLGNLSLGFSRYLLLNRQVSEEIPQDLVRQILDRMLQHGDKYKADGLKALGVIVFLFGRRHEFDNLDGKVVLDNPLGLSGLAEEETNRFGVLLVRLQHIRNPFIHPEFSEREKLSEMRKLVFECLKLVKKISR